MKVVRTNEEQAEAAKASKKAYVCFAYRSNDPGKDNWNWVVSHETDSLLDAQSWFAGRKKARVLRNDGSIVAAK